VLPKWCVSFSPLFFRLLGLRGQLLIASRRADIGRFSRYGLLVFLMTCGERPRPRQDIAMRLPAITFKPKHFPTYPIFLHIAGITPEGRNTPLLASSS
jgi:hypothetical protein